MTISSCISHREKTVSAIVREDYYRLLNCDEVGAAILNVFEYWANGCISRMSADSEVDSVSLGTRNISDFERMTLWQATDKTIRLKLREIEERGYISIENGKGRFCNEMSFVLHISELNSALSQIDWSISLRDLRKQCPKRQKATVNKPPLATVNKPDVAVNKPPLATVNKPSDYIQENLLIKESSYIREESAIAPKAEIVPFTSGFTDERVAPETLTSLTDKAEDLQQNDRSALRSNVPARENDSQFKKSQMTAEFFEPLRSLYNQKKPSTWAVCESINKTRLAAFKALYEEWGDRTIEALEDALGFISQDKWWRETCRCRNIDALLRRGRVTEFRDNFKTSKPTIAPVRNEETGYVSTGATAEAIAAVADDEMFQKLFMKKAQ